MALRLTLDTSQATTKLNLKTIVACGFWSSDQSKYIKQFETDPLLNFLISNDYGVFNAQTLDEAKQLVAQQKPATLIIKIEPFDPYKLRTFFYPPLWLSSESTTIRTLYTNHPTSELRISWYHWGITHVFDPSISPAELVARCEASHRLLMV